MAKKNLQSFYQERSKIILFQNRAEIFNMSDTTRLYHFESLKKYIKSSWISKIEVDGIVYSDKHNIEEVINNKLEASLSQSFVLDVDKCNKLFSFNIPKIDDTENILFCKDISLKELRNALRQLRASASPGLDAIPSTLYLKLFDLIGPHLCQVLNDILHGEQP